MQWRRGAPARSRQAPSLRARSGALFSRPGPSGLFVFPPRRAQIKHPRGAIAYTHRHQQQSCQISARALGPVNPEYSRVHQTGSTTTSGGRREKQYIKTPQQSSGEEAVRVSARGWKSGARGARGAAAVESTAGSSLRVLGGTFGAAQHRDTN